MQNLNDMKFLMGQTIENKQNFKQARNFQGDDVILLSVGALRGESSKEEETGHMMY